MSRKSGTGEAPVKAPLVGSVSESPPEWLTGVLRSSGVLPSGVSVQGITSEKVGTGQMGANYRLTISYDRQVDTAPDRLVVKMTSEDEGSRTIAKVVGAYDREVHFYAEIAHQLEVRCPRCYATAVAEDGSAFLLLLEDLSPATECGQIEGCSLERAKLALDQAVLLHAGSWNDAHLQSLEWLRGVLGAMEMQLAMLPTISAGFRARYADVLEEKYLAVGDRLADGSGKAWLGKMYEPRCLYHADFRLDNLLYDARGGEVPLAVVDWQLVGMSAGTADASYFLGAGLPTEVRRENEERLMRHYHAGLVDRGVSDYSWDHCWQDYREDAVIGLVITMVASIAVERTPRGDEMFLTMARRHGEQILDLDSFGSIGA